MREQPALALDATAIAGQRSIRPDDAMTGDDDADRITTVGKADRAHRGGSTDAPRQRRVGDRLAAPDLPQRPPDPALEFGPAGGDRQGVDRREITGEISTDCSAETTGIHPRTQRKSLI